MSDLSTDLLAEARKGDGQEAPRALVRPVVPGSPMALFQPAVPISDPELPFAPPIDPVAAEQPPTDALRPSDPTELMAVTTADPILELPPEGMLRITKGSESRFIWPVHAQGWMELGWTVVLPVTPERPVAADALAPAPTAALPAELAPPESAEPLDAAAVPLDLLAGAGESAEAPMAVPLEEQMPVLSTSETGGVPDYAGMTKAQIIDHCAEAHAVMLDSSLTKAQLVEEAVRLDGEAALLPVSDDV